jgi:aquaporin Z
MSENGRIAAAEGLGTAVLVMVGAGSAIIAGSKIGNAGVAIAFGLSLLTMAYAIGGISGCHINPAVSVGLWATGKLKAEKLPVYIVPQVLGGLLGALIIFAIANGVSGFSAADSGFASNGYNAHSPGGYGLGSVIVSEIVMTAIFVIVVCSTSRRSMPAGFTGLAVGLALTMVHLVSIPVDNTSVNPARSLATAVFQHGWALQQIWVFLIFPTVGGVLAGLIWKQVVQPGDA